MYDWLIVGAGFAGSVLAERLANERGEKVLVVDRRPHIGGNAYDRHDEAGILIHQYGPHIFHTNSQPIFDYLSRFTAWRPYEHHVLGAVDGKLVPIPINLDTVNAAVRPRAHVGRAGRLVRRQRAEHVEEIKHLRGRGGVEGRSRTLRESSFAATRASNGVWTRPNSTSP